MSNIVVIGSSNTDMILRVGQIPAPGETVMGGSFASVPGGKGANQAVAAARAGAAVTFVGCVGADSFGQQTIDSLAAERIDVRHVSVDAMNPSGVAFIFVDARGENSIGVAPGANASLSREHLFAAQDLIASADAVLAQLETSMEAVEAAIEIAHEHGVPFMLNPAPAQTLPLSLYSRIRVLTPNESEAALLTGIRADSEEAAARAAEILHERGVQIVLITLGERGVYTSDLKSGYRELLPAFRVKAVDTTAAGDVFSGAFAAAFAGGEVLPAAVTFANAAAALSVTKLGAQPSIPRRADIEAFLAAHASDGASRWFQNKGVASRGAVASR